MTIRTYSSPEAFKQALEQRLRTSAKSGAEFARKRQLLFNANRPHQGSKQRIPAGSATFEDGATGAVTALPVVGGLHHDYRRAAQRLRRRTERRKRYAAG
jgi:hypothetical protein